MKLWLEFLTTNTQPHTNPHRCTGRHTHTHTHTHTHKHTQTLKTCGEWRSNGRLHLVVTLALLLLELIELLLFPLQPNNIFPEPVYHVRV